ncbi:hypothetical protein CONPUDRAFT_134697 [Coniophora puteana RWD-64-598 SS2]|uniref:Uncharacterized protein n=1 Tax=Coniophora puteana (strain RWD-64-598) TaxID=741705 RepID=A0A5M3N082_CONPW|nr:uncharacterized protein CONPUDRAFT_134697 [Coniophora puteana RWD-64-598 SS2]EIW84823.1 hypothetical protein CONPUDRAFT_134697 [Coniophora puteana RWD-64-598 SS2]
MYLKMSQPSRASLETSRISLEVGRGGRPVVERHRKTRIHAHALCPNKERVSDCEGYRASDLKEFPTTGVVPSDRLLVGRCQS